MLQCDKTGSREALGRLQTALQPLAQVATCVKSGEAVHAFSALLARLMHFHSAIMGHQSVGHGEVHTFEEGLLKFVSLLSGANFVFKHC